MTSAAYAAHIVTADAGMGDPEVIVMTSVDEAGSSDVLISYPLPEGGSTEQILLDGGWAVTGEVTYAGDGYTIVDVTPMNWATIVEAVTFERKRAEIEHERQDVAWRTVIRDAVSDDESPTELAKVAGISRERVYQIRDGRR
jgi:hypothetical protein